jgi:hypothetical protein
MAVWHEFFEQHEHGERRDPEQIHDAAREEQRHEEPAAANAVKPVVGTREKRAGSSRTPMLREKLCRRAAMP